MIPCGPESPVNTVLTVDVASSSFRTELFPVSAIYKLEPAKSRDMACGVLNVATAPNPLLLPGKLPARILITPPGVILRIECKERTYRILE